MVIVSTVQSKKKSLLFSSQTLTFKCWTYSVPDTETTASMELTECEFHVK